MHVLRLHNRHLKLMAALLILILTALPTTLVASECTVPSEYTGTRDCTATERWGQCLLAAYESWEDCEERYGIVAGWTLCQLALTADVLACSVEAGIDRIVQR